MKTLIILLATLTTSLWAQNPIFRCVSQYYQVDISSYDPQLEIEAKNLLDRSTVAFGFERTIEERGDEIIYTFDAIPNGTLVLTLPTDFMIKQQFFGWMRIDRMGRGIENSLRCRKLN